MKIYLDVCYLNCHNAYQNITKHLGIVGMLRFIQQFDRSSGDYTKEREKLLGDPTIDEIKADIRQIKTLLASIHPVPRKDAGQS